MTPSLRVAFFPDTFLEVDGVANTSRHFAGFARREGLPMLVVHGGSSNAIFEEGSVARCQLRRGPIGFGLDTNHDFDLLFLRHYEAVVQRLTQFKPDLIHITGPSDVGILGALLAHNRQIPLVASWHTNVHQYAERRAMPFLRMLSAETAGRIGRWVREKSFAATARFYQIPRLLFAPNRELIELLEASTRKPCFLMGRGVDTELFRPQRRRRRDNAFVIGYVGRLTPEKNVAFLAELEQALLSAGAGNFRFLIVGQGSSQEWLRQHMKHAELPGVLLGEPLAEAYANMDLFVFPSRTDVFGNVVQEALAAGVPAIVTDCGGPQFIIRDSETGFVARATCEWVDLIRLLQTDAGRLNAMRQAARAQAEGASWDEVFRSVYARYPQALVRPSRSQHPLLMSPAAA